MLYHSCCVVSDMIHRVATWGLGPLAALVGLGREALHGGGAAAGNGAAALQEAPPGGAVHGAPDAWQ